MIGKVAPVVTGVVIGAGGVLWGVSHGNDNNDGVKAPIQAAAPKPKIELSTADRLRSHVRELGHPVYWAGAMPKRSLEVSEIKGGNITVRYLVKGTPAGLQKPRFLLIGTYPVNGAFAGIQRASHAKDAIVNHLPNGGLAVTYRSRPTNTFFARPGSKVQVEVFDPRPFRARNMVLNGKITAVAPAS
jgi:hypothetical protein